MSRENQKKKRLPVVALAGRRNAGKSSLFNAILGRNRAITDSTAGLTRDILKAEVIRGDYHFYLTDTPGLDLDAEDDLERIVLEKASVYLNTIDLILFLCEPPAPGSFDLDFYDKLRKNISSIPILTVLNKMDSHDNDQEYLNNYYEAGMNPFPVSALNRRNIPELLEQMSAIVPAVKKTPHPTERSDKENDEQPSQEKSTIVSDHEDADLRVAIVGKQNAGKSSLFNKLTGSDAAIVSDVAGTTRDTLDTRVRYFGRSVRLIDTAGLKKQTRVRQSADYYSMSRTKRAIQDADVVIHLVDATAGFSDYDKKISALLNRMNRPVILALNKWDAVPEKDEKSTERYKKDLMSRFSYAKGMPVFFISALTGKRISALIEEAFRLKEKSSFRLNTGRLNDLLPKWLNGRNGIPRDFRVYYATQAEVSPPVFVLFVSHKSTLRRSVIQYIQNRIRKEFSLDGIPIKIELREKSAK